MMPLTRTELKNLRALRNKKGRREQGRFLAEGVRLLEEALRYAFLPAMAYDNPLALSERGAMLVAQLRSAGVAVQDVTAKQLEAMADTRAPQGVVAVFVVPDPDPQELFERRYRKVVLCDSISDPGNLGTLIRSALAFEFEAVVLTGDAADPYSPKVVRSSAGAVFGIPVLAINVDEAVRLVQGGGYALLAASGKGSSDMNKLNRVIAGHDFLLAVGSEGHGVSDTLMEQSTMCWRITHSDAVESLNAAVAGSIIMKQVYDAGH
jgi:TrmH family RNA methyltransferase